MLLLSLNIYTTVYSILHSSTSLSSLNYPVPGSSLQLFTKILTSPVRKPQAYFNSRLPCSVVPLTVPLRSVPSRAPNARPVARAAGPTPSWAGFWAYVRYIWELGELGALGWDAGLDRDVGKFSNGKRFGILR